MLGNYENGHIVMVRNDERKEKLFKGDKWQVYKFIDKKWKLSRSDIKSINGEKYITIWELRNKTPGMYGYEFHSVIIITDYEGRTYDDKIEKIYVDKGNSYRTDAFCNNVKYNMGVDILAKKGEDFTSCNASLNDRSLIALFNCVFPGAEIDYNASEIVNALND